MAIGAPAIPFLIDSLDDGTPTRTFVWHQPGRHPGLSMLRRQDIAINCLERIVGCKFYESYTSTPLHVDTPERRSALANVREWWKLSQGKPQAEMIRNQLALRSKNITLRNWDKVGDLEALAMLIGPGAVMAEARALPADDPSDNSRRDLLHLLDPRLVVVEVFARFRENRSRSGDYSTLLRFGDRKVYQEIARRFEATGTLDPGPWEVPGQLREAVGCGKNWAIPLMAKALERTEVNGARYIAGGTHSFSIADVAAESFQKLTRKDFGYHPADSQEKRSAAIEAASAWWSAHGRTELAAKIAEDHPPVVDPGDLFLSDDDVARRVAAIDGNDPQQRAKTVASFGDVRSWEVQQALLHAMDKETGSKERLAMLKAVAGHPAIWQFPALATRFEHDPDPALRELAAQCMNRVLADKTTPIWWVRLETRDCGLAAIRRVAQDKKALDSLRRIAVDALIAWDSLVDQPLLRELATEPAIQGYRPLTQYLKRQDMYLAIPGPPAAKK